MNKKDIGKRIKQRRTELEMTQGDIADCIGVAISTVQRYEAGTIENPKIPVLQAIARAIHVSPDWLVGKTDSMTDAVQPTSLSSKIIRPNITEDVVTFPVVSSVAAHYDSLSIDESLVGDTVDIPVFYLRGRKRSDFCVMRVKGDSMYPNFHDGDYVLILLQATLNHSGDIGVICYGDDEMTLKRINYVDGEDWLEMIPLNPSYPTKKIVDSDLEHCRVIGIPRLLIREFW